jgi:hypothetical protein
MRKIRCALLLLLVIVGSLKSFGQFDRNNIWQVSVSEVDCLFLVKYNHIELTGKGIILTSNT